jgi:hypothetical protein
LTASITAPFVLSVILLSGLAASPSFAVPEIWRQNVDRCLEHSALNYAEPFVITQEN